VSAITHGCCIVRENGKEGEHECAVYEYEEIVDLRKIVAIGRNYVDHVKELNNVVPKEPFFFLKPTTSYVSSGGIIEIPRGIVAHHEGMSLSVLGVLAC